ncbi:hypothetical protein [Azohydromonas lata]|uniref:Uncharacterized protein n=1 Tax=Azohydromonas lata TaxID=45677 RepID=A0ABU5IFK8_9BURK|nr:hypothetical protein [Azohydromonas lata]MDZ5457886.1 hypothetical protein [Azohydromonas lata]
MREAGCLWDDFVIELLIAATRQRNRGANDPDDDSDDLMPAQRVVPAAGTAPPPVTATARSVFDLAQDVESGPVRVHRHNMPGSSSGFSLSASAKPRRAFNTVARAGAVVRVSGLAYPGNRWTAEKAEKERARRARQKVPPPSLAAKNFKFSKAGAAPDTARTEQR